VSARDDGSSIFSIDSESQKPNPVPQPKQPPSVKPVSKTAAKPADHRQKLAELKEAHRNQLQALKSRHQSEQKLLRDALSEQKKQAKEALKEAREGSQKFYESQVKQMRSEYSSQVDLLRKELRQYLEKSVSALMKNYESESAKENDEKLEGLKSMIHDDFLEALQRKAEEIDLLRVQSNEEVQKLAQDNNEKSHRIAQLEIKMKEISHYLPEDVQEDVYEQFGFEENLEGLEDEPKSKRKGLLARITSVF
jgi:hypothetical protein